MIVTIILSVIVVCFDSIDYYHYHYGHIFYILEWIFTLQFTLEYILRIYCIKKPMLYIKSFYGIVDFISIMPTYLSLLIPSSRYMMIIRILRVLRIFRILKLIAYLGESSMLIKAILSSKRKIIIFLFYLATLIIILGSMMYLIEGEKNGFTSIPKSIYWAIVTITTVGYGDISPQTNLGQALASFVMIIGYAIIAVPTGIISAEYSNLYNIQSSIVCNGCGKENHENSAHFCNKCGNKISNL